MTLRRPSPSAHLRALPFAALALLALPVTLRAAPPDPAPRADAARETQKPGAPAFPGPPRRATPLRPVPAPEPAPALETLLERLAARARQYESLALRFICMEWVRDSNDPPGEAKRYDYMYVEAQEQRYLPYRQRHTGRLGRSVPETGLQFNFPDSYSWTLMFLPRRQHLFRFLYAGEEWFSLRRSYILEFTAPLPFTSGRTIYEWSGRVWVDAENYNLLKVEAEPGNQAERLKLELQAYRQAPRFLIFPMSRKPRGARYNITFLSEFQTLSLPDQAEYREYLLEIDGSEEFAGMTTLRYSGYQFFNVDAKEFLK